MVHSDSLTSSSFWKHTESPTLSDVMGRRFFVRETLNSSVSMHLSSIKLHSPAIRALNVSGIAIATAVTNAAFVVDCTGVKLTDTSVIKRISGSIIVELFLAHARAFSNRTRIASEASEETVATPCLLDTNEGVRSVNMLKLMSLLSVITNLLRCLLS
jgi:hypothetical protein